MQFLVPLNDTTLFSSSCDGRRFSLFPIKEEQAEGLSHLPKMAQLSGVCELRASAFWKLQNLSQTLGREMWPRSDNLHSLGGDAS